jgi:hypothetical protein
MANAYITNPNLKSTKMYLTLPQEDQFLPQVQP